MNIEIFYTSLFWFFLAMVFAGIEVEIEGKHGWAEKTSTWFRTEGFIPKLYGLVMGGRPLTGYHLLMFLLPILMFHSQFVMGVAWSVEAELLIWALYLVWMPTWDFLWFVLNPYYGIKKFKKENVWWHARSHWLFNITPLDYVFGWGVSVLLALLAAEVSGNQILLKDHLGLMGWFAVFTSITILLLGPWYRKWHQHMLSHDDRENSGIFHKDEE